MSIKAYIVGKLRRSGAFCRTYVFKCGWHGLKYSGFRMVTEMPMDEIEKN